MSNLFDARPRAIPLLAAAPSFLLIEGKPIPKGVDEVQNIGPASTEGGESRCGQRVTRMVVVIDDDDDEQLYKDGEAVDSTEDQVFADDLADAAEGKLIDLTIKKIDFVHENWPSKLSDALEEPAINGDY